MEPYHSSTTKRLGIPDLLDWEAGDQKRTRLGLSEESHYNLEASSFDLLRPNEDPNGKIQRAKLDCTLGSPYPVSHGYAEAADVRMGDACAPRDDHVVGLDYDWKIEPPVKMVCFGMVCIWDIRSSSV